MLTKEVNDWIKKVEHGNYSSWEIMEEFAKMAKFLTKQEMAQIAQKLKKYELFQHKI